MRTKFIRTLRVKEYLHDRGRRLSPAFITVLDAFIQRLLDRAVNTHNGGKVTIDADVAGFIGIKP